ncbi:MAG: (2Fe-2S)-binding protein [Sulfurovum sp.]|nr:MAG: (2Fe-2S)-binding protein [Sulfurovum sp.]RUM72828.1 MAG: (2Fe-2S)-binding protein [Sulfurovum sp.]RUM73600.1 MAG: (2Fe-2S)-binding protein [Sulfurovum sp.]
MPKLTMTINNKQIEPMEISEEIMMIEYLHEYLNLTGTKFGCGQGECSACEIIVDHKDGTSESVKTCINSALTFQGKKIRTIEGHAKKNAKGYAVKLNPVQEAFAKQFSFQCGWCTPGFTNRATLLLEELEKNPIKKEDLRTHISEHLNSHLCRCTGYVKYFKALEDLILSKKGLTL